MKSDESGERCQCGHASSFHAKGTGACLFPGCSCWMIIYSPDGKPVKTQKVVRDVTFSNQE